LTFFITLPLPSLLLIVETIFAQFSGQTQVIQLLIQQITALAGPAVAQLFKHCLLAQRRLSRHLGPQLLWWASLWAELLVPLLFCATV
jgi:uncharacterized BrkB/YihY/UPF0761 family membrane protein